MEVLVELQCAGTFTSIYCELNVLLTDVLHSPLFFTRVNCDVEIDIAKRFRISKYPTLKISLNGDIMRWEYRGQRSVDALLEFVRNQLQDPIQEFNNSNDLKHLNTKTGMIIAHFSHKNTAEYQIYRRVASNLKEDCDFYAGFDGKTGLFSSK